jgi:hypothetical protein
MSTLSRIDTRRHSCECRCEGCERNGTGFFAVIAVLAGDLSAADRLSQPVCAVLLAERASAMEATSDAALDERTPGNEAKEDEDK